MAANESYIFFYGGPNEDWVRRFTETADRVAQHRFLRQHPLNISVDVHVVRPDTTTISAFGQNLPKIYKDGRRTDVRDIFRLFGNNQSGWVVLSQGGNAIVLSDDGSKMLNVLENFEDWIRDIPAQGFGRSFVNFHRRSNWFGWYVITNRKYV